MDTMEGDMKLLLESLQCSDLDTEQQIEALKTIAAMCNCDKKGGCMTKLGGLEIITNLFFNTSSPVLKQWLLFVLSNAVQNSASNKKKLCSTEIIKHVNEILSCRKPTILHVFASHFLLSLCTNFALAQNIARCSGCLERLIFLYKTTIPTSDEWFESSNNSTKKNLWTTVSSTLCSMMGDPQNDENKGICAELLPQAIGILKNTNDDIVCSALNFISHIITTNGSTQRMLKIIGGLHALVKLLQRTIQSNNDNHDMTSSILHTISCGITDFEGSKDLVGSLGIISLTLDVIKDDSKPDLLRTSALMCLSGCIDDCSVNHERLYKCNGLQVLVSLIIESSNEETRKFAILILQNCKISSEDRTLASTAQNLPFECQKKESQNFLRNVTNKRSHLSPAYYGSNQTTIHRIRISDNGNACIKDLNKLNDCEKDSTILSILQNQSKILTSVTQQVSELRRSFNALSDTGSSKSLVRSPSRQRIAPSSTAPAETSMHGGKRMRSCSVKTELENENRKWVFLPRRGDSKSTSSKFSSRGSVSTITSRSYTSKGKSKQNKTGRHDLTKIALMNAHKKSKGSNLFIASKMGQLDNKEKSVVNGVRPKLNTKLLDNGTCTETRACDIREENRRKLHSTGLSTRKFYKNTRSSFSESVSSVKYKNGIKCNEFDIIKCNTNRKEEKIFSESQMNQGVKRMNKRETHRLLKERSKDLPTVIGGVPMIEQSSREKVKGWIAKNIPFAYHSEEDSIDKNMKGVTNNVVAETDIEGVSGMSMSDTSDEVSSIEDGDILERQNDNIDQKQESKEHSVDNRTMINCNVDRIFTPDVTKSETPRMKLAYRNEENTPSDVLPTRVASAKYKIKRSLGFNVENSSNEDDNEEDVCGMPLSDIDDEISSIDDDEIFGWQEDDRDRRQISKGYSKEDRTAAVDTSEDKSPALIKSKRSDLSQKKSCSQDGTAKNHAANGKETGEEELPSVDQPMVNGDNVSQTLNNTKCLGCYPFCRFPFFVLNKRNCVSALRKDEHTCTFHKNFITEKDQEWKQPLQQQSNKLTKEISRHVGSKRNNEKEPLDIKDGPLNADVNIDGKEMKSREVRSLCENGTPEARDVVKNYDKCSSVATSFRKRKRKRKEYEEFEIENIYKGVKQFGRRWTAILNAYPFKMGRTAEDLKDKYKRLCKSSGSSVTSSIQRTQGPIPFTSQEIVNLKAGYGRYGARWKTILKHFNFQKGRNALDLEIRYSKHLKTII